MRKAEQVSQIKKIFSRMDSGTNVDAGGLRCNPSKVYTDSELADKEWQAFFRGHPQIIGLSGDLPEPGSFLTLSDFGTSIIASRDKDGQFRAFVNACRHRGALVESERRGKKHVFSCPFHAWSYAPDGRLVNLPKSEHFGDVDRACLGLRELPAVESHGFLWVHPDPEAQLDIDKLLGPELSDELHSWHLDEMQVLDEDTYEIPCNWKLANDTFGETYHFSVLHKDTLAAIFHGNVQCYDTYGRHHRMLLVRREIDGLRALSEDNWEITTATLPAYWLFPNVQLLPFKEGCYLVRIYPVPGQPGRHVSRISFYLRPGLAESDVQNNRDVQLTLAQGFAQIIRDEDYVMSASQQTSAETGASTHVIFGRNEPALHHYHQTYRDALNMEPLPLLDEGEVGKRVLG